ncbi:latent-transforming growth factor beta-binding protein 4-like [Aphelocoma coerulescens]|uniref:latent-transforming growth factor beta-binding protein 4-like n=1 Tax=Aphelocoma coerulescens TaxID=39617 RepID=UPI003605399D
MAMGPALLLAALLPLLAPGSPLAPPGGPGPPRLRLRFSPPRCCPGGRCAPGCRPRGRPGLPGALRRSIYTLPLSNHREEEDGAQSMVSVVVRHPPEATVTIHSVERVRGGDPSPAAPTPPLGQGETPEPHPKIPGFGTKGPPPDPPGRGGFGFGYCFRQLRGGQVPRVTPVPPPAEPCPPGFQRRNGSCEDVDECQEGTLCQHGLCTNTRGGFACLCPPGFLLDSSRSSCISQQVLSEARGPCFRLLREGGGCALPTLRNITRQVCCCSRVGKAWGGSCLLCPPFGSEGFKEICPAGPGYHYSPSDLRINTQFLGQDVTGVPLGPPRAPPTASPEPPQFGTPRPPPPPPPGPEVIVVPRPSPDFGGALPTLPPPEPVSPCQRDPAVCGPGRCVPRGGGGYTCLCRGGFWLSPQGTHCVDVDECAQSPPPCAHGRCENRPGGYQCVCPAGYRGSGGDQPCQDIDECENHLACPGQECVNTPGSFRCQPCPDGFRLRQGRCADVDECSGGSPCAPHGRCLNTAGSFRCECHRGYRATAGATACQDVNECLEGDFCFPHGECVNTAGSFRCLCADGFAGTADGTACADVDECQRGDVCAGGRCLNTDGSFQCQCPAGFRTDDAKAECQDVDECQEYGAGLCGAQRCENIPGSYRCVPECQPGFRPGHGGDCVDVDECQEYGAGLCGAQRCENIPGSYRCVPECQPGFRPGHGGDCVDVDECSNGTLCGPHATCHNLPGSFQCACDPGYETAQHGHHCVVSPVPSQCACDPGYEITWHGHLPGDTQIPLPVAIPVSPVPSQCACDPGYETAQHGHHCVGMATVGWRHGHHPGDTATVGCRHGHHPGDTATTLGTPKSHSLWPSQCPQSHPSAPATPAMRLPGMATTLGTRPPPWGHGHHPGDTQIPVPVAPVAIPVSPVPSQCACDPGYETARHGHHCVVPSQCACNPGYETAQHGHHCVDVDECQTLRGVCGAERCENVEGSFLCLCPDSRQEFDPISGRCGAAPTPQTPKPPQTPPNPPGSALASCFSRACGLLAPNVTRPQCCCTLGWAWGAQCPGQPCPTPGTEDHLSLCPHGPGRVPEGPQGPPADVDECALFAPALCRGGVCVNAPPAFSCYCPSGFYFEQEHLQCVDNDECAAAEAEPCLGGLCVNTVGSYLCSCPPPLILDPSQRRCVANDSSPEGSVAVCWQEVGPDLVCGRPRRAGQVTYTECCCLYGQAWGMDCALCPAPHSDDFELLCNVLRPPNFAPPLYDPSPNFPPPLPHLPPHPQFGPLPYGGRGRGPRFEPPEPPPDPRGGPPWDFQALGTPEEEEEEEEGAQDEQCGVLSGCTHGRCVRVGDAFTCACDPGFRLDPARLDCLDVDECSALPPPCRPGRCLNTAGSFRCLCPPGTPPGAGPPPPADPLPPPPRA